VIALIAGGLFTAFVLITPRFAATGSATPRPEPIEQSLPAAETQAAPTTTIPVTQAPADGAPVEAVPAIPTTTLPQSTAPGATIPTAPERDPIEMTRPSGLHYDGTLALALELSADEASPDDDTFSRGDELTWRFRVSNVSDEELWGIFVFLELHGRASCDGSHLLPGETLDCWATTRAIDGTHVAEAWANAWTLDRQVAAALDHVFVVSL